MLHRFLSVPQHIDQKCKQESQFPTIPQPASRTLKESMKREWNEVHAMLPCKEKDKKKLELIELEEKKLITDDAYHVAVDTLGLASALQQEGLCTKATCTEPSAQSVQVSLLSLHCRRGPW